jgi:hypothetical protein
MREKRWTHYAVSKCTSEARVRVLCLKSEMKFRTTQELVGCQQTDRHFDSR